MYTQCMSTITATEARKNFASVIGAAQSEAVIIEKHGERQAIVISAAEYDRLMSAVEENEDVSAFDAAMAEEGPSIPWDLAKADLGWT